MTRSGWRTAIGFAVATLCGTSLVAQAPPAPRPAPSGAPVPPPVTALPAQARGSAPGARPVTKAPATYSPIRPASSPNVSVPDSLRPAAPPATQAPPSGAVAQCVDGSYILPPNDSRGCAAHRGVRVLFPHASMSPAHAAATRTAATKSAMPANAAAPAGSTMRCRDGTYLAGPPAPRRCDAYGGLAAVLASGKPAPAPPPHAAR